MLSFLIRISAGQRSFATLRSFSQLVTSFFGAMYQGILLYALCSLFLFRSLTQNLSALCEFSVELSLNTLQKKFFNSRCYTYRINLYSYFYCLSVLCYLDNISVISSFLYYAVVNLRSLSKPLKLLTYLASLLIISL